MTSDLAASAALALTLVGCGADRLATADQTPLPTAPSAEAPSAPATTEPGNVATTRGPDVNVANLTQAPSGRFTLSVAGTNATLRAELRDPQDDDILISIDWGHGGLEHLSTSAFEATHQYPAAGIYQVHVKISDDKGNTGEPWSQTIQVRDFPVDGLVLHEGFGGNGSRWTTQRAGAGTGGVATTDRFGSRDGAFQFDGQADDHGYALAPRVEAINPASFSISVWVNPNGDLDGVLVGQAGVFMLEVNGHRPALRLGTGSAVVIADAFLPKNQWSLLTAVKQGRDVMLFIDDKLVKHGTVLGAQYRSCDGISINSAPRCDGAAQGFKTSTAYGFDDVRVYSSTALDGGDIRALLYEGAENS